MRSQIPNTRSKPDKVLTDIADYFASFLVNSKEAYNTARLCLMDTLGCGLEALEYPACTKLLGLIVPGTVVLVKIASNALVTRRIGGNRKEIADAVFTRMVELSTRLTAGCAAGRAVLI